MKLHIQMRFYTLVLITVRAIFIESVVVDFDDSNLSLSFHNHHLLSRQEFTKFLHTGFDDKCTLQHFSEDNHHERTLRGKPMPSQVIDENTWSSMLQHGWTKIMNHGRERDLRSEMSTLRGNVSFISDGIVNNEFETHPFVLCSSYFNQSGYLRLQRILTAFNTSIAMAQTLYNSEESSCFVLVASSKDVQHAFGSTYKYSRAIKDNDEGDFLLNNVTFVPLVDVLKFAAGTPSFILEDNDWMPKSVDTSSKLRKASMNSTIKEDVEEGWSRSILVDLVPGRYQGSKNDRKEIESLAKEILDYVATMANVTSNTTQALTTRSMKNKKSTTGLISTREAFSLTARSSSYSDSYQKRAFRSPRNIWSNALAHGFEKYNGCHHMFKSLDVRPRGIYVETNPDNLKESSSITGFELILRAAPSKGKDKENLPDGLLDSSAQNKQCALSLIIGLSVHPLVQTIQVGQQLEVSSIEGTTNPQWITQSGAVNSRPFFDKGLDGSGQIVAVADGGLDRDNCYFLDADGSRGNIFGSSWDFTQRKIVNYDDSFADKKERSMGHGTYVSGIIAGKKSSNGEDEEEGFAEGVAPGSKISFFDMEIESSGIQDPGVSRLFSSFYNAGNGSHIMNASWGRGYKGIYSMYCRDYDSALRSTYSDVLFVVSSGNTGSGGISSSIQNPADCKNVLSVGASLSYGDDIRWSEKGIDYLAEYTSRGPTFDGRMKPDLVGPGHFIIAPNADPDDVGECDGSSPPNARYSLSSGNGARYVTGTSMSAPVVAGAASIVRQYFAEGWCDEIRCCGFKSCGVSVNPSGALLKAVLMNSAQPLTGGIQTVPDGDVLENQPIYEYDNAQGMGRVNLINSLPLKDVNLIELMIVNDKTLKNGAKDVYEVKIDTSNGCDSDLRVTLAWSDPPGAVGCTNCVINDLDLYVEEINRSETIFPNGLTKYDSKNTVERIRTKVSHGEEYQVIVHARNFAFDSQRYSLVISGCLNEDDEAAPTSTKSIVAQSALSIENEVITKSPVCSNGTLFEMELNTANNSNSISWDLVKATADNKALVILSGPEKSSNYSTNEKYYYSICLSPERYRFQIRNNYGSIKIMIANEIVVESFQDDESIFNLRFRVNDDNEYVPISTKRTRSPFYEPKFLTIDDELV